MNNKTCKKIGALLAAVITLTYCLSVQVVVYAKYKQNFQGYTAISTKEELNEVRNDLSGKYYLTADIELDPNSEWEPIGNSFENVFIGIFDGNGHTITGLYINEDIINTEETSKIYSGLFGYNKGVIKNLGLINSIVSSTCCFVGGVTGLNEGSIINCYNTGNINAISSSNTYVGGIAGSNFYGILINCYNTGNVNIELLSKETCAGGIVGFNAGKNIMNCYNMGSVSINDNTTDSDGYAFCGGIAGYSGICTISDCYNTGSVNSLADIICAGGITGYCACNITNCYNVGSINVSSLPSNVLAGGIAGKFESESNIDITDCYYLNNIEKGLGTGEVKAISCTEEQMKQKETFIGFDFKNVWKIGNNQDYFYPQLLKMMYGDVDKDGVITAADALLALQFSVKKVSFDEVQKEIADVDYDGSVNANDALMILQHSVCKITSFPNRD